MTASSKHRSQDDVAKDEHQPISASLLRAAAQASHDSSGESGVEDDNGPEEAGQSQKRKKRSRACQACRGMKIRCIPVEGQEACQACSKVNRQCIMPGPARKRQKTVHKVAELEKKIDALTQSLIAKNQGHPTPPQESPAGTDATRSSVSVAPAQPVDKTFFYHPTLEKTFLEPKPTAQGQASSPQPPGPEVDDYTDVIDQGVLSIATATKIFESFKKDMNPLSPLVGFRDGVSIDYMRQKRPMLFLTTLTAACGLIAPAYRQSLEEELARQLSDRVMYRFEKSLDLVQAMLLLSTWIGRHKNAKDLGFNQYIHSAIVMALDMGLGKRLRTPLAKDAYEDVEMRRTWLACYYNGICVSTTMRQPALVQNSAYIQESLDILKNSPAASALDARLCSMVKLIQIMEDVTTCFHMDDPLSSVGMEDPATRFHLKLFEKRIAEWKATEGKNLHPLIVEHITSAASLFIHEIAIHENHNVDDFKPAYQPAGREMAPTSNFFTSAHLEALTTCVCEMKNVLETFVTILSNVSKTLPALHVVWTTYAVVAMIRLHGALSLPGSKYGDVFLGDLKVDDYLDAIIAQLSRMGSTYSTFPTFLNAFQKLKAWHRHRQSGSSSNLWTDDMKEGMPKTFAKSAAELESSDAETLGRSETVSHTEKLTPESQYKHVRLAGANTGAPTWMFPTDTSGTTAGMQPTNYDASMFENQDWNFTLEDWNNFDASLNEPAGSAWIGYLM